MPALRPIRRNAPSACRWANRSTRRRVLSSTRFSPVRARSRIIHDARSACVARGDCRLARASPRPACARSGDASAARPGQPRSFVRICTDGHRRHAAARDGGRAESVLSDLRGRRAAGRRATYCVNADPAAGFAHRWSAVPADVWARTQLLYVCSPDNPTGRVLDLPGGASSLRCPTATDS
jgi:hypothetical protein